MFYWTLDLEVLISRVEKSDSLKWSKAPLNQQTQILTRTLACKEYWNRNHQKLSFYRWSKEYQESNTEVEPRSEERVEEAIGYEEIESIIVFDIRNDRTL